MSTFQLVRCSSSYLKLRGFETGFGSRKEVEIETSGTITARLTENRAEKVLGKNENNGKFTTTIRILAINLSYV